MTKRCWLINIRKSTDMTQSEVAKNAKIARTTYAMYEVGDRNPSVQVAKRISKVLGFNWVLFFDESLHNSCNEKNKNILINH